MTLPPLREVGQDARAALLVLAELQRMDVGVDDPELARRLLRGPVLQGGRHGGPPGSRRDADRWSRGARATGVAIVFKVAAGRRSDERHDLALPAEQRMRAMLVKDPDGTILQFDERVEG